MPLSDLPFQPMRRSLYSAEELMQGFDAHDPESFADVADFRIYECFVRSGGANSEDHFVSMMQAMHDHSISQSMLKGLKRKPRVAAVMGGHRMERGSAPYRSIVEMSRRLTQLGFLMASGGGPGAMEATHVGAFFADSPDDALAQAMTMLESVPKLPDTRGIVRPEGLDRDAVLASHRWLLAAVLARESVHTPCASLAVPTWHYGHEPFPPFATHVAKYFQNSIREDGLLALAADGIVYTEGKAGTLQEIFQDAAQNYYHTEHNRFSPMVFFGTRYWREEFPLEPILRHLFDKTDFDERVCFTDSVDEAIEFLCLAPLRLPEPELQPEPQPERIDA